MINAINLELLGTGEQAMRSVKKGRRTLGLLMGCLSHWMNISEELGHSNSFLTSIALTPIEHLISRVSTFTETALGDHTAEPI